MTRGKGRQTVEHRAATLLRVAAAFVSTTGVIAAASAFGVSLTIVTSTLARQPSGTCASFRAASGPHGYRWIADRCEGEYRVEVSSSLFVVSLTEGEVPSGVDVDALAISWAATDVANLAIEARVLEPRSYYRMDASVPGGAAGTFAWPLSELRAAGFGGRPLGIRATVPAASAATPLAFVPIKVRRRASAPERGESYHAALVGGDEVSDVTTTVHDSCAGPQPIWKNEPLRPELRYAAGVPIRLEFPRSKCGAGRYRVSVFAMGRSEPVHCRFEFTHD